MTEGVQVALLCGVSAALIALAIWIALRVHGTPEKRERKRRLNVHRQGRLGDAMISEATDSTLYYFYTVRRRAVHGFTGCFDAAGVFAGGSAPADWRGGAEVFFEESGEFDFGVRGVVGVEGAGGGSGRRGRHERVAR